ncbi:MAG: cysteine--tRNA ligase [Acholeplasmataceae bacterium]|jgi:cysteinyl-tRNA synthetase|nr:cysteine--tRNA ligase [Candidatus Izemoplasmatales bacterium]
MKIYNTYTSSLEDFVPIKKNQVSIYVCGPTVYNYIHIGNARPVVFFDTVRRYFEYKGYTVKFASNFTDVDDKIINKAIEENLTELEVTRFYINSFLTDLKNLGCFTDYIQPKVTEYMSKIISYIDELVRLGYAYSIQGDVYFRVSKIDEYGHLSNRKLDDLISGARVDVNPLKESPLDFTLWKKTDEGIAWDSTYSKGRPGWHTECVAMIDDIFGGEIDIHGGGSDLLFPHHENEIAQSMATHNNNIAHFWMHNGRLNMEGEKMSKSLGNSLFVKDLPGNKMAFRLFLLSTYYRSPINFNMDSLEAVEKDYIKLENTVTSLYRHLDLNNELSETTVENEEILGMLNRFNDAFEQDFNTPNAITELQAMVKSINVLMRQNSDFSLLNQALKVVLSMTGILGFDFHLEPLSSEDKSLFTLWNEARKNKDFKLADHYRGILQEKGKI